MGGGTGPFSKWESDLDFVQNPSCYQGIGELQIFKYDSKIPIPIVVIQTIIKRFIPIFHSETLLPNTT